MVSYYAWNMLLSFIISFGFVSAVFMVNKYTNLEKAYCRLDKQKRMLEEELKTYNQTK